MCRCGDKGDCHAPCLSRGPLAPSLVLGVGGLRVLDPRPLSVGHLSTRPPSQDKLGSQSFGTDLPLVDHQVEQHNIFHNEVKAIGPHLAKDGGKVRVVVERAWPRGKGGSCLQPCLDPPCPRLCLQEQNSELQAKYQKLLVRRTPPPPGEGDGRGWGARGVGTESVCSEHFKWNERG